MLNSEEAPLIAILDWMMPKMDGVEVCRYIRKQNKAPYIYMILLTASGGDDNIIEGFKAGADDYITKPFGAHELEMRLGVGRRIVELEEQLRRQALYDQLTTLPNRSQFVRYLDRLVLRSQVHNKYKFAVLFLDIDRFKIINDSLGHIVGDQIIIEVAKRLQSCVRSTDMAARFGGDEFVILLDDISDINYATCIADRIQEKLSMPFNLNGQDVSTTVSIGIAQSVTGYSSSKDILRDADSAMYLAKSRGRARYEIFDSSIYTRDLGA